MKSYKHLWDEFISDKNIREAIHKASLGNKSKKVKNRLKKIDANKEKYIPKIRDIAENFRNGNHKPIEIYDGIQRKKRTIIVPNPYEQVVHHMVVNTLRPIWQIFRFDYPHKGHGRCIDFMGFRFYRDKVTLRKSIMLKASRKARRIAKKDKVYWYDAAQMVSYCGWFKSCDAYGCFEARIYPYVQIRNLRKKISHHSRKVA